MAMNVGPPKRRGRSVSTINTTPLVDVMLVLLIIFLITIPVVTHVDPGAAAQGDERVRETKPENIVISVDARTATSTGTTAEVAQHRRLIDRLKKIAVLEPQPEVQIRGDGGRYDSVGRIIYACQRAGIAKVGFITEPPPAAADALAATGISSWQ